MVYKIYLLLKSTVDEYWMIIIEIKVHLPQVWETVADFSYTVNVFSFICPQRLFNYLAFQSFDFER